MPTLKEEMLVEVTYDGLSNLEIAAVLNTLNQDAPIPSIDVKRYLLLKGKWPGIVDAAAHSDTAAIRQAATNMVESLASFVDFNTGDATILAAVTAGLDALVATALMTATNKTEILAMKSNRKSLADVNGWGYLKEGDIEMAKVI